MNKSNTPTQKHPERAPKTCEQSKPLKILLALSGGVDSAVAAYLMKERGHDVSAAYMKTWVYEDGDTLFQDCPWEDDIQNAEQVCKHLGIPFQVMHFAKEYREKVVNYLVSGYRQGTTPNPDLLCNREMKFGVFLDYARANGFDGIATGHYVRGLQAENGQHHILQGMDPNKDQSYFLALLNQEQLRHAYFPIGSLQKSEVRQIAEQIKLPNAKRKDSQGICFLGKVRINEFLAEYIKDKPGDIITPKGEVRGQHLGLHRYTIGQRKGINIPSNTDHKHFVVIAKDYESNQLVIDFDSPTAPGLYSEEARLREIHWINEPVTTDTKLLGKVRYRDPSVELRFEPEENQCAKISFKKPQRALANGQLLALYDGERLLGGGFYY